MTDLYIRPDDLEYTTIGGRLPKPPPPPPRRLTAQDKHHLDRIREAHDARRRAHDAAHRRSHPDAGIYGLAVPYRTRLPGGRDDTLWFDQSTMWLNGDRVQLQLEHGGSLLGHATIDEQRSGIYIDGTIYNGLRNRVKDRRQLSVKIDNLDLEPRPDGSMLVRQARLVEISLVNSAMWRPLTDCVVWQRAS